MALFLESGLPRFVGRRVTLFGSEEEAHHPPRLLVRTLLVTFATVFVILLAVFLTLVADLRARVRDEVGDNLDGARLLVAGVEQRRLADAETRLATLAGNPTLEAAVVKYRNEFGGFTALEVRQSAIWLAGELQSIAEAARADVAVAIDPRGMTMAQAGRLGAGWPAHLSVPALADGVRSRVDVLPVAGDTYRVTSLPLLAGRERVGTLCLAARLDAGLASDVSTLTRAETVILAHGSLLASTLSPAATDLLGATWRVSPGDGGDVIVGGETYAYRRLETLDGARIYALASVSTPASRTTSKAFRALLLVGVGALALAILGSFFLARTLAGPIDGISRSLSAAVTSRDFGIRLTSDGSSREIDVLTETFNQLMGSLSRAEEERRAAYLEAIEALAKALEARDGYTAGHSERVGDLSVRIARRMGMTTQETDVLRLGASLHDIGKIGIVDAVLRKEGPLTAAERVAIQAHPLVGARILQPVAFLADHLRIVELHHEQPDGRGYPHGLTGDRIPLSARIVHLADAYDAMTSNRPYRRGRSADEAIDEIVQRRGTQFDEAVVDAFLGVMREEEAVNAVPALISSRRPAAPSA